MRHVTTGVMAIMPGRVGMHRGTRQSGLIMDEQYHKPERGFAGGYFIETSSTDPASVAVGFGEWGDKVSGWMEKYDNMAATFITGEDPPEASNRITLHPTEKDEQGLAVPVLDYAMHPNSTAMQNHANRTSTEIFESLGGEVVSKIEGIGFGCHNMGVARMSENPEDGVTNRWGQVHDIPNLFVSDGSVFTSSAAANPTLTITALAIRQADHIAGRMSRREL